MEAVIETLATGLGNGVAWLAETGLLFLVFAALWGLIGAGLLLSQGSVDQAWEWVRSLPLALQVVAWLLFLPVMLGLWIWESTWPLFVRITLVIGVAGWNLLVLLPRWLQSRS